METKRLFPGLILAGMTASAGFAEDTTLGREYCPATRASLASCMNLLPQGPHNIDIEGDIGDRK
jgi:hypothetical protein